MCFLSHIRLPYIVWSAKQRFIRVRPEDVVSSSHLLSDLEWLWSVIWLSRSIHQHLFLLKQTLASVKWCDIHVRAAQNCTLIFLCEKQSFFQKKYFWNWAWFWFTYWCRSKNYSVPFMWCYAQYTWISILNSNMIKMKIITVEPTNISCSTTNDGKGWALLIRVIVTIWVW